MDSMTDNRYVLARICFRLVFQMRCAAGTCGCRKLFWFSAISRSLGSTTVCLFLHIFRTPSTYTVTYAFVHEPILFHPPT